MQAFALQCLGKCGRHNYFDEAEDVTGIFDGCGEEIALSGTYVTVLVIHHVIMETVLTDCQ